MFEAEICRKENDMPVATPSTYDCPWFTAEEKIKTMEFTPKCPCTLQFTDPTIFGIEFLVLEDVPKRIRIAKKGETNFYVTFPYSSFDMANAALATASAVAPSQPDGPIIVR